MFPALAAAAAVTTSGTRETGEESPMRKVDGVSCPVAPPSPSNCQDWGCLLGTRGTGNDARSVPKSARSRGNALKQARYRFALP